MNSGPLQTITEETSLYMESARTIYGPLQNCISPPHESGSTLRISMIPKNCAKEALIRYFSLFGVLYRLTLGVNSRTRKSRIADVTYMSEYQALYACYKIRNSFFQPSVRFRAIQIIPNHRLYAKNIPKRATKPQVIAEFQKLVYGLENIRFFEDFKNEKDRNNGSAFLEFRTHQDAARALRYLVARRPVLYKQNIYVDWAVSYERISLFVTNVRTIDEEVIKAAFEEDANGTLKSVFKIDDVAILSYKNMQAAVKALGNHNGTLLQDVRLRISINRQLIWGIPHHHNIKVGQGQRNYIEELESEKENVAENNQELQHHHVMQERTVQNNPIPVLNVSGPSNNQVNQQKNKTAAKKKKKVPSSQRMTNINNQIPVIINQRTDYGPGTSFQQQQEFVGEPQQYYEPQHQEQNGEYYQQQQQVPREYHPHSFQVVYCPPVYPIYPPNPYLAPSAPCVGYYAMSEPRNGTTYYNYQPILSGVSPTATQDDNAKLVHTICENNQFGYPKFFPVIEQDPRSGQPLYKIRAYIPYIFEHLKHFFETPVATPNFEEATNNCIAEILKYFCNVLVTVCP